MACKTCDHTMTGLGRVESGYRYYWCPRCGTLKAESRNFTDWTAPRGWARAMEVLRQLIYGPDCDENVLVCHEEAAKVLGDCDPERKEETGA